ncbi:tail fiber assembly protein [Kluyvera intermedia]|uniref:tail fiber assembly protein n=1 Tax=Kluyvera intermedia TaxID=61648 RepID=UPI0035259FE9
MNFFDAVKNENIHITVVEGVMPFLVGASIDANGQNYYDFQKTITEKYTCVIHAESGILRYFNEDASAIAPGVGERVFGIDEITPEGVAFDGSWKFDEETLTFYQDTLIVAVNVLRANTAQHETLTRKAITSISAILNSAEIGKPREGDAENLLALRQFVDALRDVDLTLAEPVWPPAPPFLL